MFLSHAAAVLHLAQIPTVTTIRARSNYYTANNAQIEVTFNFNRQKYFSQSAFIVCII